MHLLERLLHSFLPLSERQEREDDVLQVLSLLLLRRCARGRGRQAPGASAPGARRAAALPAVSKKKTKGAWAWAARRKPGSPANSAICVQATASLRFWSESWF